MYTILYIYINVCCVDISCILLLARPPASAGDVANSSLNARDPLYAQVPHAPTLNMRDLHLSFFSLLCRDQLGSWGIR